MAGERTVKVRFTGDVKGLASAAAGAKKTMGVFKKNIEDGTKESTSGVGSLLKGAFTNPYVLGAVGVAALGLGQIAGAAIVAGLGLGVLSLVLVAGIKGAAADPKVQQAWGGFTKKASAAFKAFSEPFKGPVLAAIKTFGEAMDRMKPTFAAIGKLVAPLVDKLAPALTKLVENALPGFQGFLKTATPLMETLAEKMPGLGTAIGSFFGKLSDGGPAAQQFLKDFFDFLLWVIPKIGEFLSWLSKQYINWRTLVLTVIAAVKSAWAGFRDFFSGIGQRIGEVVGRVVVKYQEFRDRARSTWDAIVSKVASAVGTIERWWNRLLNLARTPVNFVAGVFGKIPGLPGRASGGSVGAGRSYLVGERGPEVLTMGSAGGHITPNHELGGGPEVLELHVDLGEGIRQVVQVNLREHDRGLRRRAMAAGGAR